MLTRRQREERKEQLFKAACNILGIDPDTLSYEEPTKLPKSLINTPRTNEEIVALAEAYNLLVDLANGHALDEELALEEELDPEEELLHINIGEVYILALLAMSACYNLGYIVPQNKENARLFLKEANNLSLMRADNTFNDVYNSPPNGEPDGHSLKSVESTLSSRSGVSTISESPETTEEPTAHTSKGLLRNSSQISTKNNKPQHLNQPPAPPIPKTNLIIPNRTEEFIPCTMVFKNGTQITLV